MAFAPKKFSQTRTAREARRRLARQLDGADGDLALWRAVNRERKTAGLPRLSRDCLGLTRVVVRPFVESEEEPKNGGAAPQEAA